MSLNIYILTYNRAKYLKEAIRSVLSQSYIEFELYILDNCSSDDTYDVVNSFYDIRLHYIRHKQNIGGIANLQYAIKHCTADYFVVFHDDDIMLPNFIKDEIRVMESNSHIAVVSGNAVLIDKNSKDGKLAFLTPCNDTMYYAYDTYLNYLKHGRTLIFPSLMYRNSFIKKNNISLKEFIGPCLDVIFYFDIAKYGGVIYEISHAVMKYRQHIYQDSRLNMDTMHLQLYEYLKSDVYYASLFHKYKKNIYKKHIHRIIVLFLRGEEKQSKRLYYAYSECIMNKKQCVWNLYYEIIIRFPNFFRRLYKLYKILKREK